MEGIIHSFESLAALDGKGLRFAVFLAGCPLRCAFCHNPDTWRMTGRSVTATTLVQKISRFKPYFGADGGVTFSGGEPLLQARFLCEVIPLLQEEGIRYVVDTSGAVELTEDVKCVLKGAQEVLLDLKFWDEASYLQYTGKDSTLTLQTLAFLNEAGVKTVLRTVVIPGINDSEKLLSRYLSHLAGVSCVAKYELLPFHTMGFFKYKELGIENPLAEKVALSHERCKELQAFINENLPFLKRK